MYLAHGVYSYVHDDQNKQLQKDSTEMVFVKETECVLSEVDS